MNTEENVLGCLLSLFAVAEHPMGVCIHTLRMLFYQLAEFVRFCHFRPWDAPRDYIIPRTGARPSDI